MNQNTPVSHRKAIRQVFYARNRFSFFCTLVLFLLLSVTGPLVSWLLGRIVDIITEQSADHLRSLFFAIAGGVAVFLVLSAASDFFRSRFVHRAIRQYKQYAFRELCAKSVSSFSTDNTGRYLSVLTNDIQTIEDHYLAGFFTIPYQGLSFLLSLGMMLYLSPLLTLITIGLSSFSVLVSAVMGKTVTIRTKAVSDQNEHFTVRLKDLLNGFSVIKSFRAESRTQTLFDKQNSDLEHTKEGRRFSQDLLGTLTSVAGMIMQFGVFFTGALFAIRGDITTGTVLIFINNCNYLMQPIQLIPQALAMRKSAGALIDKCADIMSAGKSREGIAAGNDLKEGILLKDLSFSYTEEDGADVLQHMNLRFAPGKSYAVVGSSGSGKSTLLQLLMGTYEHYRGSLTLDGHEIKDIDPDSLYDLERLIDQNVFLFDDSIGNNITMFGDFDEASVQQAVQKAALTKVIEEHGIDYLCGENGSNLSGGERQRISIARALLSGAKVLLVDEATSALDAENAALVTDTILSLQGLTRIVVTHRIEPSQLARYDEIIMLKNGTVAEQGSFDDLMAQKGSFYALQKLAA